MTDTVYGPYFDAAAAQFRNLAVRDPMLVANDAFCENGRNSLKPLVRCYFWRDRAHSIYPDIPQFGGPSSASPTLPEVEQPDARPYDTIIIRSIVIGTSLEE